MNFLYTFFTEWCLQMNIQVSLEEMSDAELDHHLRSFYASARKQNGEDYTRSSLLSFRNSIERYLNNPPINRGIRLSGNQEFTSSNKVLEAKIKSLKRDGHGGTVKHKAVIESTDLKKLKQCGVFSPDNPWSLLRNVWFHISLHWCRRGSEGLSRLKKTSFIIRDDGQGTRRYAIMTHDEVSKNHQGGFNEKASSERETRMYETDSPVDGLKSLELYLAKLNPSCDALFQYPKRKFIKEDTVWYENRPLGKNKLQTMMSTISELAQLSKKYTNHCVRATAITLWSDNDIPGRHIISISGHTNEQSLAHYNRRPSTSQLKVCSDILAEALEPLDSSSTAALVPASHPAPIQRPSLSMVQAAADNRSCIFPAGLLQNCSINNVQIHVHNGNSS